MPINNIKELYQHVKKILLAPIRSLISALKKFFITFIKNLYQRLREKLIYDVIVALIVTAIIALVLNPWGFKERVISLFQSSDSSQAIVQQPSSTPTSAPSDNELAYAKIEKLATGISGRNLESIFGIPRVERPLDKRYALRQANGKFVSLVLSDNYDGFVERIFVDPNYYVQTISTKEDVVIFFSVTSRNQEFNPRVPIELYSFSATRQVYLSISNLRIGKMKFADFKEYDRPENYCVTSPVSQPGYYVESQYFGNPGGYDHYLLSLSSVGFGYRDRSLFSFDTYLFGNLTNNLLSNPQFVTWRETTMPNAYGVLEGYKTYSELLDYIIGNGFGPSAVDARGL